MVKLNLGSGQNPEPGYINVDKYEAFSPDIIWDLEEFPWPFETSSAQEIILRHVLEHLGATTACFLGIMKELYRISAPGARTMIYVPHPRSDGYWGDPTHVRPITPQVLALFSKKNNREWKALGWPNTPLATYIDVDFEMSGVSLNLSPRWSRQLNGGKITQDEINFAIESHFNVVDEISLTLTAVK
jgi:hypothetical protein